MAKKSAKNGAKISAKTGKFTREPDPDTTYTRTRRGWAVKYDNQYLQVELGIVSWRADRSLATLFARKKDAERAIPRVGESGQSFLTFLKIKY